MTKLTIKRTSEWTNRMRDIGIYLDGKKIGTIANGETKEFEIDPGAHTLKSKIDWCGSEEIKLNLQESETKVIELSGFKYGKIIMPFSLIISAFYFWSGSKLNFDPLMYLLIIIPFATYLMYYLTWGRNKYLQLKEK